MFVGTVSAGECPCPARMIRVAKAEAIDEELQRSHIVFGEKHDMIDGLRYRPLTPLAVQIQPLNFAGSVDRVRLTQYGTLVPDAQTQRHAIIGKKMRRAVGVAAYLAIAGKICNQFFQRLCRVNAPDGLAYSRLIGVCRRQANIVAAAHHDLRTRHYFEYTFLGAQRDGGQAEIRPKFTALRDVIDAEDCALNS